MEGINGITNSQLSFHAMKVFAALEGLAIPFAIADGIHTAAPDQFRIIGEVGVETRGGRVRATAFVDCVVGLAPKEGNLTEHFLQGEVMIRAPQPLKLLFM